jgi:hypothetical protein
MFLQMVPASLLGRLFLMAPRAEFVSVMGVPASIFQIAKFTVRVQLGKKS